MTRDSVVDDCEVEQLGSWKTLGSIPKISPGLGASPAGSNSQAEEGWSGLPPRAAWILHGIDRSYHVPEPA